MTNRSTYPRLLGDIGGTNARFVLETGPRRFEFVQVLACAEYRSLDSALAVYLEYAQAQCRCPVRHAALAIANPVDGDSVKMTNHHWHFSISALRERFAFDTLEVVNDFKALAMALPLLPREKTVKVGAGKARKESVIGLVGAGTGLGVSALIPVDGKYVAMDSEGGHVTFSPSTDTEMAILHIARRDYPHVSAERLMSGVGLHIVYRALAELENCTPDDIDVPQIIKRGLAKSCAICDKTIDAFCDMLGTLAGNIGVTFGAKGGIYIGGGIVPRLGTRFADSGFRARFESKGRFSSYLAEIPTYVIVDDFPAFLGISAILDQSSRAYT
ncbi:MAG TPA: glucokinase [Burkholderiaceae bacterium]